ncbi:hypothetical protein QFC19_001335 [Naganishia cerealis]|uniref:Uncharacterized protein n=1 Tax=Naganishia cerealis TaxID=610337 RepID=A0ACC2WJ70_9TREE|nr:hypothetical protein QFC19_001335 [Naganishia cerealis]
MTILPILLLILLIKTPSICHAGFAAKHILKPAVTSGGQLTSLKYTNVGGSGSYQRVTGMLEDDGLSCSKPKDFCIKSPVTVSGPLSPFDSDLTLVFSGPTKIYNIAVYQPPGSSNTANWARVSRFKAGKPNPKNLVFMNNQGGKIGSKSGTWGPCGGSSQSYASGDFAGNVSTPNQEVFTGDVPPGLEVNIMTSTKCTSSSNCPGYYRGTAHAGWSGSKLFVIEFSMPDAHDIAMKPPAIWILNGEVVRAAQYGCNCRGMGGKGGCGELDILENLKDAPYNGISELYRQVPINRPGKLDG